MKSGGLKTNVKSGIENVTPVIAPMCRLRRSNAVCPGIKQSVGEAVLACILIVGDIVNSQFLRWFV